MSEAVYFPEAASNHPPRQLGWATVRRARALMRQGRDLSEAAWICGVRARDLDLSLWNTIQNEAW